MKIYLGSKSELKYSALRQAIEFLRLHNFIDNQPEIMVIEAKSGVPATPNESETYYGARSRATELVNDSDSLFIGVESGLIKREGCIFEECWCVVLDKNKKEWVGVSSAIQLPTSVSNRMDSGESHIDCISKLADERGLPIKDTWGVYSKGSLPRSISLFEAVRNALVSYFTKEDLK